MMRNALLAALGYAVVFSLTAQAQAPQALPAAIAVTNGDFEANAQTPQGWRFWSRTGDGAATLMPEGHGGKFAAHIVYPGERDWAFTNESRLPVTPGQVFTVSAWVRGSNGVELAVVALAGDKTLRWDIGSDAASTSNTWLRLAGEVHVPEGCDHIQIRFIGNAKSDVVVDDVTLHPGGLPVITKPPVHGWAQTRVRERLSRGVIALPMAGNQVYVGWRLLAGDPAITAFHVYRRSGNGAPVRLTATPLRQTTDFVDAQPPAGEQRYFVRPVIAGKEGPASETVTATPSAEGQPYLSFKLAGNYTFQKIAIADLDGDGQYDYVLKQPDANVDPYAAYWTKSPDTFKLEAYRHDGKLLWHYDMGWSIERGIWYSPYVVFDLDGDGRAEVALKSGEGDARDADGRVTSGPEYLSILDGLSGKVKARVPWPSRDGFPDYNYYSRNQLGLAFLDGKTPCLIVERGTYNTIKVVAYTYHGGKLNELWHWNNRESGGLFRGQGAHCLRAADVDGDGRDEVILGSAVLDDNGQGLWATGFGHPDQATVGDLDPTHPGLEIAYGMEPRQPKNGLCMVDAKTGKLLWGLQESTTHVHGQGLCADIDPTHPGAELYGGERDDKEKRWLFSAKGELIATKDLGGAWHRERLIGMPTPSGN